MDSAVNNLGIHGSYIVVLSLYIVASSASPSGQLIAKAFLIKQILNIGTYM
jgi:hypothetical protein